VNSKPGNQLSSKDGPVLVTGHTGFKGAWLTQLLEYLDVEVVGLSLPAEKDSLYFRNTALSKIPEVFGDIRDFSVITKTLKRFRPSTIVHLAAQPLVLESYKSPIETFATNVMGTANLLESSIRTNYVENILVVTTDKVYQNNESSKVFSEGDPLEGKDPYSASKVGTESVARAWRNLSEKISGPNISVARAGNVIGGGDYARDRLFPDLVRSLISNTELEVRNPESTRPWQHVLDPLLGYIRFLEHPNFGNIRALNFGPTSESLKVREVIAIAENAYGEKFNVSLANKSEERNEEARNLDLNSSLAGTTLNWRSKFTQETSIILTMLWWKKIINGSHSAKDACLQDIEQILD
jgi:CDP-glucose 4,6-dehydratase